MWICVSKLFHVVIVALIIAAVSRSADVSGCVAATDDGNGDPSHTQLSIVPRRPAGPLADGHQRNQPAERCRGVLKSWTKEFRWPPLSEEVQILQS